MIREIMCTINGQRHIIEVEPTDNMGSILRDKLGLKGTHKDCSMGICGACTILLDDKPVSSCLLLAPQADGKEIRTVEGLEQDGKLSPLQEAFLMFGAVQCGYCTPGFLMTATALLEENAKPNRIEITNALKGNLCRCTGYKKIIEAVEFVASH